MYRRMKLYGWNTEGYDVWSWYRVWERNTDRAVVGRPEREYLGVVAINVGQY